MNFSELEPEITPLRWIDSQLHMAVPPFSLHDLPRGLLDSLYGKVMRSERRIRGIVAEYDEILERSGIKAAVTLDSDARPADPLIWKRIYLTEDPAATAYKMGISVVRNGWPLSCYSSVPPRIPTPFRDPGPSVEEHELEAALLEAWRQAYELRQEELSSGLSWRIPAVTEPPTTACTSCGEVVPIEDTWSPKGDDRPFEQKRCLCQSCFRKEEEAGRAKGVEQ